MTSDDLKRKAALCAMDLVKPGMRLGLGTGSTAAHFVDLLGRRVAEGLRVVCVPTSESTREQAAGLGIPLTTLDATPELDLTVDGADEVDAELRLIKGGGGALLREKIVATASSRVVIIADASKRVDTLGAFPLPIEIVRFGQVATCKMIEEIARDAGLAGRITMRLGADRQPIITANGNYIVDCAFGRIDDPELFEDGLALVPGVVTSGLFLGIADIVMLAGPGGVDIIEADWMDEGAS